MSFDNVDNLLRSDHTLTWRSAPQCPKCHQAYSSSYVRQGISRRAFILKCDHLMCERCISDMVHGPNQAAVCRICNIRTVLDKKRRVYDQLQHSYQMLGFLYQRQHAISRLAPVSPLGPLAPGENRDVEEDDDKECYECNIARTRHYCYECGIALCRDCFEKIHRVGKILSKHKLCSLTAKKWMQGDVSICDDHKLTTGLFCTNCEVRVCVTCRNESHSSHYCANLVDINRETQPRLKPLIKDLEQAYAMNVQGRKVSRSELFIILVENNDFDCIPAGRFEYNLKCQLDVITDNEVWNCSPMINRESFEIMHTLKSFSMSLDCRQLLT
ncbi:uncharacterized protein LOC134206818 [Armigeres subalbatus]|uniref:uncharacterized protein LOC134206818 n=1 Tax=Armigeres subalbatus TaxID=124917 RepID=UPI002ED1E547